MPRQQAGGKAVENGEKDYVDLDAHVVKNKVSLHTTQAAARLATATNSSDGLCEFIEVVEKEQKKIQRAIEVPCLPANLTPEATAVFVPAMEEACSNLASDVQKFRQEKTREALQKMIDNLKNSVKKMSGVSGIYNPVNEMKDD